VLGTILVIAGDCDRGYPLLLRHAESGDAEGRSLTGDFVPARSGLFACWMEDYGTARRELVRAVDLARDRGLVSFLLVALGALGELELHVGNWRAARVHAEHALRLAEEADHLLNFGYTVLLTLAAATGDVDGVRTLGDAVSAIAAHSGSPLMEIHAHAGRGLLELGLDHPEAAIAHLACAREIAERVGIKEPNYVQWMPNLIESQIRAGLVSEAQGTLAVFEDQAQRTSRRWALATAARCRGLLAPADTADEVFAEAYRLVCALPSPFERARTELCWGERLRRDGRRIEARRHLHDAHQRFDALGAVPWAEKAARELRSSGGRARRGPRARTSELTPQQAQIATMVAEGRTNKSIANSLFLSPRTIEFHLSQVYRKLDITNRTQLARALLISPAPPG
jgi:DNA-binding CsgD family transcriptional regulator